MDDPQLAGDFWDQYGPTLGVLILLALLALSAVIATIARRIRRTRRRRRYYEKLSRQEPAFKLREAGSEDKDESVIV